MARRGVALACLMGLLGPAVAMAAKLPPPPTPAARSGAAIAAFGGNQVILFSGRGVSGALADTWSWDGSKWTELHPATSPPARIGAVMAYDAVRGVTVLFGGRTDSADGTQFLADTWTWDGSNWSLHPLAAASPPPRSDAAMAPDLGNGTLLLFGGMNADGSLGDTWSWDGLAWRPEVLAGDAPAARHGAGLAAMPDHVLLFGGQRADGLVLNDTYIWSNGWTLHGRSSPPRPRAGHAMAGYSSAGQAILFGGRAQSSLFDDTFMWDGISWTPSDGVSRPQARASASMANLAATNVMVLFGGDDGSALFGDTWTWNGSNWQLMGPTSTKKQR